MKTRLVLALLATAIALPALAIAASPAAKPADKPARLTPDANNDGYLSRAEAQAMADARFARLDANGDGKLMPGEHPTRAKPADGAGQQADGQGWKGHGGRGHWRVRAMGMRGIGPNAFAEYDANHDGALEISEFRAHALKLFAAQDGNNDGVVKLPERPARKG